MGSNAALLALMRLVEGPARDVPVADARAALDDAYAPNAYIRDMRARYRCEAETAETATVQEAVHWRFSNVPGLCNEEMDRLLAIRVDAEHHPTQVNLARLRRDIAHRDQEHAAFFASLQGEWP